MKRIEHIWVLIPVLGAVVFVIFYLIATRYYPGGSQLDKDAIGFSWMNNYWCNLLNEDAINGQHNSAKPIALTGMCVLCLTLSIFWVVFPRHLKLRENIKLIVQISGILSMTIACFLLTNINHDFVTNLASILGLIATAGTFAGLYKAKWFGLLAFGFVNILLVGLNNYVYYSEGLIIYLPIIQKISFATFLLWICAICITLNKKITKGEFSKLHREY